MILLDNINTYLNNEIIYLYSYGSINLMNNSTTKSIYIYTDLNYNDTKYSLKRTSYSLILIISNVINIIKKQSVNNSVYKLIKQIEYK